MEAFGLAAGVLQVAGFGAEVGSTLLRCAKKLQNASKELESIAGQVETTALSLKRVDELLKDPATKALHTPKLYEDTNTVSQGCHEVFRELDKSVKAYEAKSTSGKMRLLSRTKWLFDSSRLAELGQVLRRYNDVLHLMVSVMTIVEGRRAATKDELQALEANLQVLALSNKDLSETNKTLSETIAVISRTSNSPFLWPAIPATPPAQSLGTPAIQQDTMFNAFVSVPFGNTTVQPPPSTPTSDHLQRCMDSVQELSKTIACAMDQWHGRGLLGCSDIHDSYAKVSANLEQLPVDIECMRCTRRIYKSNLHRSPSRVSLYSTCVCDLNPEPAKRRRVSGAPPELVVTGQTASSAIDSDTAMSPRRTSCDLRLVPQSDSQMPVDGPSPCPAADLVLPDCDLDLDLGLDFATPAVTESLASTKQYTHQTPDTSPDLRPVAVARRENNVRIKSSLHGSQGATQKRGGRVRSSALSKEQRDRCPPMRKLRAGNTSHLNRDGCVDPSPNEPPTPLAGDAGTTTQLDGILPPLLEYRGGPTVLSAIPGADKLPTHGGSMSGLVSDPDENMDSNSDGEGRFRARSLRRSNTGSRSMSRQAISPEQSDKSFHECERRRLVEEYHPTGKSSRTVDDDNAYSYTDAASMYKDTEPRWRETRPRRNSVDRGGASRERPVSMIEPYRADPRRSIREIGPPPSQRDWDKINDLGRSRSTRDPVPHSPSRGARDRDESHRRYTKSRDPYYIAPRKSSPERSSTRAVYQNRPDERYTPGYDGHRESRHYKRRLSATVPDMKSPEQEGQSQYAQQVRQLSNCKHQAYSRMASREHASIPMLSLPPPPSRPTTTTKIDGQPLQHATYAPGGDSFGPGVGIPMMGQPENTTCAPRSDDQNPTSAAPLSHMGFLSALEEVSCASRATREHKRPYLEASPSTNANSTSSVEDSMANRRPRLECSDDAITESTVGKTRSETDNADGSYIINEDEAGNDADVGDDYDATRDTSAVQALLARWLDSSASALLLRDDETVT